MTVLAVLAYLLAAPLAVLYLARLSAYPLEFCVSMRVFGQPCPLCGMTRGLNALLHGHAVAATVLNPLTVPVALLFAVEFVYRGLFLLGRVPVAASTGARRADLWLHVALLVVYLAYSLAFYLT